MPFASTLYADTMRQNAPPGVRLEFDTIFPCAESYAPPSDDELAAYDGCAFTGSSYSAYDDADDVRAQIALCSRTFECGVSSFGSCWALQIAAEALGGAVTLNPRGREVGVGRKITLTDEGMEHPMYAGKKRAFEAFESHSDEITRVPEGGVVLASNDHTAVQGMAVVRNGVESWFCQYHPEYDLGYFASLIEIRTQRMCDMGFFRAPEDVAHYVAELRALHEQPGARPDLRWKYGIDDDMIDKTIKQAEVRNWLGHLLSTR